MLRPFEANGLLSSLPAADRARLEPHLQRVEVRRGEIIYEPDTPLELLYFPLSGLLSQVATTFDGSEVEVSTIGREGVFGAEVAIGVESTPLRAMSQGSGTCLRMPASVVASEANAGGALIGALHEYLGVTMIEIAQSVACNRLHTTNVRLARWLLTARDRLESDELPLTHEFIAIMLGVQRPAVTIAAGALQNAGLIRYRRGLVQIIDAPALEEAACDCYTVVRRAYDQLAARRLFVVSAAS